MKLYGYEDLNTGPYIRFLGFELFIWRPYFRSGWGLDADGLFAICTPWFMLYLPFIK